MTWQSIEKEIQSILANKPKLKKLYEALESGDTIGIAGASVDLWLSWDEFLKKFIAHVQKLEKISQPNAEFFLKETPQTLLETAQQLRNKTGKQYYTESLY